MTELSTELNNHLILILHPLPLLEPYQVIHGSPLCGFRTRGPSLMLTCDALSMVSHTLPPRVVLSFCLSNSTPNIITIFIRTNTCLTRNRGPNTTDRRCQRAESHRGSATLTGALTACGPRMFPVIPALHLCRSLGFCSCQPLTAHNASWIRTARRCFFSFQRSWVAS